MAHIRLAGSPWKDTLPELIDAERRAMNSVLIVTESWGDTFFDIKSKDDLNKAALEILTERYTQGYWYNEDEDDYADIERAVAESNGALAWRILRERSDKGYEYEGVSLETYR